MKSTTKFIAPLAGAAAIAAAVGFAPLAAAATTPTPHHGPAASQSSAQSQYETGTDPLVPADTGAEPFVLVPRGYGRAF